MKLKYAFLKILFLDTAIQTLLYIGKTSSQTSLMVWSKIITMQGYLVLDCIFMMWEKMVSMMKNNTLLGNENQRKGSDHSNAVLPYINVRIYHLLTNLVILILILKFMTQRTLELKQAYAKIQTTQYSMRLEILRISALKTKEASILKQLLQ